MLRLCLSGPVELLVRETPVDLGPPQRRAVLAALAVDVGRPVPVEALVDRVWGADPPEGARRALYAHVARIRRVAERLDDSGEGRLPVLRRAGGYQLDLEPDSVDLHRFQRLAAAARDDALPDRTRAARLREALGLWRGEPFAGLPGNWPARMRETWRLQRVDAAVRLADLEIHGGDPAAVVGQLADLLGEYPLTEPLAEALMRALHAVGDSGEALRCYARTRERLVEELGTEPGRRLWELHQEILRDRPLAPAREQGRTAARGHEKAPAPKPVHPTPTTPTDRHRAGRTAPELPPTPADRSRAGRGVSDSPVAPADRSRVGQGESGPSAVPAGRHSEGRRAPEPSVVPADRSRVGQGESGPSAVPAGRYPEGRRASDSPVAPADRHRAGRGVSESSVVPADRSRAGEGELEAPAVSADRSAEGRRASESSVASADRSGAGGGVSGASAVPAGRQSEGRRASELSVAPADRQSEGRGGSGPSSAPADAHPAERAASDPAATLAVPEGGAAPYAAPAQLPPGSAGFTGRVDELAQLDALLDDVGRRPAAVVVSALSGMGGVGKTALAVHWARQARPAFPDGQLYVNLRGFDPGGAPLPPDRALRGFLEALGVPAARLPESPDAQVGLYRSLLSGRRVLVVLDNARDADQVRPLLPGAPGCLALVTSRAPLTGLAAAEGARLLALDLLGAEECRDLLAGRLGAARVAAEAAAVDEIVVRCAGLPLALAVVAARAAARPAVPLAAFADELRTAERILDPLDTGDPVTAVRTVFDWSYRTLSPEAARLFRLLGLHPGPDADLTSLAALAGVGVGRVRAPLAELTAAHLLIEHTHHRYTCHDLLRAYAVELVAEHDDARATRAATRRVLDHYLHTAYAADALLTRRRHPMTLAPAEPGALPRQLADYDEALAWLIAEQSVLLSAVERRSPGLDAHTWQLAATLTTFLERQGNWQALTDIHTVALRAAECHEDPAGQAAAHRGLGLARFQLRDRQGARYHFTRALGLFRRLDNHAGQARTCQNLAKMAWAHGVTREALHYSRRCLEHFRLAHDRGGQAVALNDIGWYLAELGELGEALEHCRQALPLVQATGDLSGQAHTWDSLGYIHRRLGRHTTAVECYDRALPLFRKTGDLRSEAICLTYLGDTHEAAGAPGPALDAWRRALDLFDELGLPEARALRTKISTTATAGLAPPPAAAHRTGHPA
ncbi:DNA-binding SARP family transcriptional activator [Streptomyces sp. Ag109_O5-1]|uniref:BTAD domain-containing putative transcriptional regulator n=1 Tax=Streptomyces sp. Ag109_O5-1 TaxID=1938851 RepID=UPI000FBE9E59|nr:BTAD domain-containing putative transcriptional regulator [Streptomyces sp. Ag109_O5-1]RPE40512.1 DNA-binding SARP family transcriptional activator [Streptomyces sp. Ag109_O5-1]